MYTNVAAANGIPVWCGGMLETGIGRAANVALACLPNFVLPDDTSASEHLRDPTVAGFGVDVLPHVLADVTTSTTSVRF